uniref:Uncharacterized protein n=1 Tax=viral metagenome TaxID=1070528 RepID=A0A6M3J012_9ZZZZ
MWITTKLSYLAEQVDVSMSDTQTIAIIVFFVIFLNMFLKLLPFQKRKKGKKWLQQ